MKQEPTVLGDFLVPVRSVSPPAVFGDQNFRYLDIASVDRESRAITACQDLHTNDAPSRARQLVAANDVIVSTVRPNLNTVAWIDDHYVGAIASTGFCVLRADPQRLDTRFLFHWISSHKIVEKLVALATGASYPAVSDKIIKSLRIDLPPLIEQKRIAATLDKADSIRRKRQRAVALVDDYLRAVFIEMFVDPEINPKGWQCVRLEEIALQVTDGEHQTPQRSADGVFLLSARNVQDGRLDFTDVDHVPQGEFERIRRRCEPVRGDILISCSGSIGRVAQVEVDFPLSLVRSVALVRPNQQRIRSGFLEFLLRSSVL